MRRYIILIVTCTVGIISIFLLFIILKPTPTETVPGNETAGFNENIGVTIKPESEDIFEDIPITEIAGVDELTAIETGELEEDIKDETKSDETVPTEQPIYIGRQIEGYVEPVNDWQSSSSFSHEEFNDYYKDYIALKNAFQSNIVIDLDNGFNFEFADFEWFKHAPKGLYYNDFMWICYAILTYFDGNVLHDYYVTSDDIYDKVHLPDALSIYHIHSAQTHGIRPLHLRIDKFNYKIRVEEGIQRKNPNCKQGCCD